MSDSQRLSAEELSALDRRLDQQLRQLQSSNSRTKSSRSFSVAGFIKKTLFSVLVLVAPFFVLIRASVYLYTRYQLNGWMALGGGVIITLLLLFLYVSVFTLQFKQNIRTFSILCRGASFLLIAYLLYGLLYYSSITTKTADIQQYYRSMHPILRVTLATVSLADSELLVTGIQRTSEDYATMGLPENQRSLHYVQKNGYVHAADLRTIGRSYLKNQMTAGILRLLGLKTIRHVGTADHLHVYLPPNK